MQVQYNTKDIIPSRCIKERMVADVSSPSHRWSGNVFERQCNEVKIDQHCPSLLGKWLTSQQKVGNLTNREHKWLFVGRLLDMLSRY